MKKNPHFPFLPKDSIEDFLNENDLVVLALSSGKNVLPRSKFIVNEILKSKQCIQIVLIDKKDRKTVEKITGISLFPQLIQNGSYIGGGLVIEEKIKTK